MGNQVVQGILLQENPTYTKYNYTKTPYAVQQMQLYPSVSNLYGMCGTTRILFQGNAEEVNGEPKSVVSIEGVTLEAYINTSQSSRIYYTYGETSTYISAGYNHQNKFAFGTKVISYDAATDTYWCELHAFTGRTGYDYNYYTTAKFPGTYAFNRVEIASPSTRYMLSMTKQIIN